MLKKLYKYDFKSIFNLWRIFAIIMFAVSVFGGFFLGALDGFNVDVNENPFTFIFISLSAIAYVFVLFAFIVSPIILSIVRFSKNLFSDEGYLTFTLPVKKRDILNAKISSALVLELLTVIVAFSSVIVYLILSKVKHPREAINIIGNFFQSFIDNGVWSIIFSVEIILLLFAILTYTLLLIYVCITFACLITKKARVITAIGIYYGVNSILGIIWKFFTMSSAYGTQIFLKLFAQSKSTIASILGIIIIFIVIICLLLYMLEYYFLDKKLNLS